MDTISNLVTLPGVTIAGKINLPAKKNVANKATKKYFKPFSGGATIRERIEFSKN